MSERDATNEQIGMVQTNIFDFEVPVQKANIFDFEVPVQKAVLYKCNNLLI